MSTDFNPYHVWLSIPPEEQPANHYRLLGIPLFETNGDVIDSAADRQMAHLRTFQSGKHGDLTQRLLNEVAAARVCLLDAKKRAAYDQLLRAQSAPSVAPAQAGTAPATGGSAIHRQPPRRPATPSPPPIPVAEILRTSTTPDSSDQWDDLLGYSKGDPSGKPAHRPGGKPANAAGAKAIVAKQRDAKNRSISIAIVGAVALVVAVGIGLFAMKKPSDGTLLFDWPAEDRASDPHGRRRSAAGPCRGRMGVPRAGGIASHRRPAFGLQARRKRRSRCWRATNGPCGMEAQSHAGVELAAGAANWRGIENRRSPATRFGAQSVGSGRSNLARMSFKSHGLVSRPFSPRRMSPRTGVDW